MKKPGTNGGFSCATVADGLYASLKVTSSLACLVRSKTKEIPF